MAASPNPFLLEVPVEQPKAERPGPKTRAMETQRFKALTPSQLAGTGDGADPTLIVEPKDVVDLVRSRSGDAAQKVIIHMISPQDDRANVVVVGRDEDADVQIDLHTVSKRHAELNEIGTDVWQIKDLGSVNGTFVDGQPVASGAYGILRDRGDVRFGTYQAIFLSSKTLYKLILRLKGKGK